MEQSQILAVAGSSMHDRQAGTDDAAVVHNVCVVPQAVLASVNVLSTVLVQAVAVAVQTESAAAPPIGSRFAAESQVVLVVVHPVVAAVCEVVAAVVHVSSAILQVLWTANSVQVH